MSMELLVFSDRKLSSIAEWQAAIDAERYPLQLDPTARIERLSGFFTMRLGGEAAGFECYQEDAARLLRDNAGVNFGGDWKYCLAFVWRGREWKELLAAWMAGIAYAHATGGMIFDSEGIRLLSPDKARQIVYEFERPSPARQAAMDEVRHQFGYDPWPKIGAKNGN